MHLLLLALVACVNTKISSDDEDGRRRGGNADSADTDALDADGDGYDIGDDCDDSDANVNPGANEVCNTRDDDCDGNIDEDATEPGTWYTDADGDGYGDDATAVQSCEPPSAGMVLRGGDCDDTTAARAPGLDEVCDSLDNDCDGTVDEEPRDGASWYTDADGDGFGDPSTGVIACVQPEGTTWDASDCDDTRNTVYPAASEFCDGLDDDCDGAVDEDALDAPTWYTDDDGDGYGDLSTAIESCTQPAGTVGIDGDCNDADAYVSPSGEEICNEVDDDCNGAVDDDASFAPTWHADRDSDGHGAIYDTVATCEAPAGYLPDGDDCDDATSVTYPGASEVCDSADNDCDGSVDEDAVDLALRFLDADGDGLGLSGTEALRCDGADNDLDCDDADGSEPVVVDASRGSSWGAGSLASPLVSVDAGIAAADTCVLVYPGTYYEVVDFGGKNVTVSSVAGAISTTIDGSGYGDAVVTFDGGETSDAVLEGFTLTGGAGRLETTTSSSSCGSGATCVTYYQAYCGGGIAADGASPTLRDLIVYANTLPAAGTTTSGSDTYVVTSFGGGACFTASNATLTDLDVRENSADDGGGLYVDPSSSISGSRVRVTANTATYGAGLHVDGGASSLTNLLSSWNVASTSGGGALVDGSGSLTLTNATFAYDEATTSGGGVLVDTATFGMRNGIVAGARAGGGLYGVGTVTAVLRYSDVQGNTGGNFVGTVSTATGTSGNISSDPRFRSVTSDGNPYNDNFRLNTGSPAINTGDPSATYNDTDGTRADMGAYGGPGGSW